MYLKNKKKKKKEKEKRKRENKKQDVGFYQPAIITLATIRARAP